jgi:hypothetical protein
MQAYWILPNRGQKDDILASDGAKIVPLRQILDPKLRPAGFSHGVPAELLEKCDPKAFAEVLFAQRFSAGSGHKQLFSISTPAGLDFLRRVVHLGILFILEPGERPTFELPCASLSEEDQGYAAALIHRMTSLGRRDSWVQSVRDLSELPYRGRPATNVALDRSAVRFYSLYVLRPGGLIKKSSNRLRTWRREAIVLLVLFAVLIAWLSLHAMNGSVSPRLRG